LLVVVVRSEYIIQCQHVNGAIYSQKSPEKERNGQNRYMGDSLWGFYALLLLESHDGVASHALKANRSIHKARK